MIKTTTEPLFIYCIFFMGFIDMNKNRTCKHSKQLNTVSLGWLFTLPPHYNLFIPK